MMREDYVATATQNMCAVSLAQLDETYRRGIMAQLCFDRIGNKQEYLVDRFHDTDNWNETAYFMLLRALDIGANRKLYESLARILPYRYMNLVGHHRHSIEALLLGCSGLLEKLRVLCPDNQDIGNLYSIFEYDSHKYGLKTMRADDWQLSGHYGDNHPVVRLLQLAEVLSRHEHLLDTLIECRTRNDVERIFCHGNIPKWAYRFLSADSHSGSFSRGKAYMFGINVVAQMQIFYSEYTMRDGLDSRGLDLLEQLPAENNTFVRRWARYNVVAKNALESQALLQLSKAYCQSLECEKCLFRRFVEAK